LPARQPPAHDGPDDYLSRVLKGHHVVRVIVYEIEPDRPASAPSDKLSLPKLQQDILRVLAEVEKPIKSATIARKLSRSCSSYFHRELAALVAAKAVLKVRDCYYWSAERTLPEGWSEG
jgi:hypothetical protein